MSSAPPEDFWRPAAEQPEPWPLPPAPPLPAARRRRGTTLLVVLAVAVLIGTVAVLGTLTGRRDAPAASAGQPRPAATPAPSAVPASPSAAATSTADAAPIPSPTPGLTLRIGREGVRYEDGVEVTVASAARWAVPRAAAGAHPGYVGVLVVVEVRNHGRVSFGTGGVAVALRYGTGRRTADAVTYAAARVGTGFTGGVGPGQTRRARFAWSIPRAELARLAIKVTPGDEYDPATFTGAAR